MIWVCGSGPSVQSGGCRPSCDDRLEAARPTNVRVMDVVHTQRALGNTPRIVTVVDTRSRFCPAADPSFISCGDDVVATVEWILCPGGLSEDYPC